MSEIPKVKIPRKQLGVLYKTPGVPFDTLSIVHEGETGDFAEPTGLVVVTHDDMMGKSIAYYPALHHEQFANLEGRILTVIDAAFPVGDQREAIKKLVKDSTRSWFNKMIEQNSERMHGSKSTNFKNQSGHPPVELLDE